MTSSEIYIEQVYLGTNRLESGDSFATGRPNIFPENNSLNANIGGYPFVIQLTNSNTTSSFSFNDSSTERINIITNYTFRNPIGSTIEQANISNIFLLNNSTPSKPPLPSGESYYLYSNIAGLSGSKILPANLVIPDAANRTIEIPFLLGDFSNSDTDVSNGTHFTASEIYFGNADGDIDKATIAGPFQTFSNYYTEATILSNIVNSNTTDFADWRRDYTSTYPNTTFSTSNWDRIGDANNTALIPRLLYIENFCLGTNRLDTGDNLATGRANIFPENNSLNANIGGYPFVIQLTNLSYSNYTFSSTDSINIITNYTFRNPVGGAIEKANISNNFLLNISTPSKPPLPFNESYYMYSNIAGLSGSKILPDDLVIPDIANRTIELPFLLADFSNSDDIANGTHFTASEIRYQDNDSINGGVYFATANIDTDVFNNYINTTILSNIVNSNTTDFADWRRKSISIFDFKPRSGFVLNDWERLSDPNNTGLISRLIYIDQLYLGTNRLDTGFNLTTDIPNIFPENNTLNANIGGYPFVIQLTNSSYSNYTFDSTSSINIITYYNFRNPVGGAVEQDNISNIFLLNNSTPSKPPLSFGESYYLYSNIAGLSGSKILPADLVIPDAANRTMELPFLLADFSNSDDVGNGVHFTASEIRFIDNDNINGGINSEIDLSTSNINYDVINNQYINTTILSNIVNSNTTNYVIWRRCSNIQTIYPLNKFSIYDWNRVGNDINSAEASRLNASAAGDPHITTVNGEYYKFDYLGAFRLYENNDLIINGLSELGDANRWEDKQYIRKVFIQYHDKSILIDTGFRGTPAKILENNGFEYTDEELEFNQLAEVNCWECRKTYNILEKGFINRHRNKYGHKILDPIRNKITIKLDNFKFEIFNVNEYNLQPCRFNFSKLDNDYSKSKGCLIERKYVGVSILEDIKDTDKMVEIDVNNNNDLVELYSTVEINVELIDPKFI